MRVIARVRIHDNVHQILHVCVMQGPHKQEKKILPSFLFYGRSLVAIAAILIQRDVTMLAKYVTVYDAAGTQHYAAAIGGFIKRCSQSAFPARCGTGGTERSRGFQASVGGGVRRTSAPRLKKKKKKKSRVPLGAAIAARMRERRGPCPLFSRWSCSESVCSQL